MLSFLIFWGISNGNYVTVPSFLVGQVTGTMEPFQFLVFLGRGEFNILFGQ
jgi:hypothetical protein